MQALVIHVADMRCMHCAAAVERAIADLPGVIRVQADFMEGTVQVVTQHPVEPTLLAAAVEEAGYQVKPAP